MACNNHNMIVACCHTCPCYACYYVSLPTTLPAYCTLLTFSVHAQEDYGSWVCLSGCVSVKSHLTSGASVNPKNTIMYSAGNGGCGVFSETTPLQRSSTFSIESHTYSPGPFPGSLWGGVLFAKIWTPTGDFK